MQNPTATLVIVTRDRKEELGRALDSCLRQAGEFEILVIDDGSSDGTAAFVRANYPRAKIVRGGESRGYITCRNEAATLATGEIIVSIDDDAEFSWPDVMANVLNEFCNDAVAAVAIPLINARTDGELKQESPDAPGIWITNQFIGTACAIRKEAFLRAGGYREFLFHQEEEGDLCIRLLERGLYVRLSSAKPILHHQSRQRSIERINVYGQRNLMLFAWYNVPFPELLLHLFVTIWNGLMWGLRHQTFRYRLRGTLSGFGAIIREFRNRAPVSRRTYWLYRELKKHGPLRLEALIEK